MIVSPVINDVSLPKCLVYKKIWASIHYWTQDSSQLVPDYLKYTYKLVEQMWHDNVFINKTYYTKTVTICKKLLTINCGSHSVTWFIVIASLMISISSPGTMPLEWVCRCTCISVIKSYEFPSCLLNVQEQTILKLFIYQLLTINKLIRYKTWWNAAWINILPVGLLYCRCAICDVKWQVV